MDNRVLRYVSDVAVFLFLQHGGVAPRCCPYVTPFCQSQPRLQGPMVGITSDPELAGTADAAANRAAGNRHRQAARLSVGDGWNPPKRLRVAPLPKDRRVPVLISRRQQFVVPAITYQRRIVQSRRGGNTVGVCRLHDCVVGVAGLPVGSRSRHLFISTQEFASWCSRRRIAFPDKRCCPPGPTGPK